jgi:DNA invertase Pin-like site-specific DNA recombinase
MQIGYARVSSDDQNLDLQLDALKAAGCKKIFDDRLSGAHTQRPGLQKLLETVREGDSVTVWRLDRLGRSMKDLLEVVAVLEANGVELNCLKEKIDTSSSGGRLVFHIFAALAEFERKLIQERTCAGLNAAKTRGRTGGRPPMLDKKEQKLLRRLYDEGEHSVEEICEILKISKATLYNYLGRERT